MADEQRPAHELDGRVVLLTGGASGIGQALSAGLRRVGCHVVELDQTALTETDPPASAGGQRWGRRIRTVGDVTDPDANQAAVTAALDAFGHLDAFIGNAGVHDGGARFMELTSRELHDLARRVMDVNVIGYLLGARAAAQEVKKSGGTMVFTLSDASFVVSGNGAGVAYAAAKHAGLGVVKSLAAQLAPAVRVNAVAPGGVITGLSSVNPGRGESAVYGDAQEMTETIRAFNPLRAVLTPEDLVPHYIYLLTSQSAGLTGHVLRPDGGLDVR